MDYPIDFLEIHMMLLTLSCRSSGLILVYLFNIFQSLCPLSAATSGIVKPLRQRIKDLETINAKHQKINGELQQQVTQKDKKIEELMERINNPLKKMREDGDL